MKNMSRILIVIALLSLVIMGYVFYNAANSNEVNTAGLTTTPTQITPTRKPTQPVSPTMATSPTVTKSLSVTPSVSTTPSVSVSPTATPTPTNVEQSSTIKYTDNGFVPSTLTVKQGTTVTFMNDSNSQMWVASNDHPAHNDLPGFDELKGVSKGGSYQFTFQQTGNWGYHNHLRAEHTGSVIVQQ